jgi:type VII secretion protein EccCa/type VII secretion protein EccCb
VTTHRFVRTADVIPAPQTGGGKIELEAPIVSPVPPVRSIWGIVLPVALVLGIIGLIVVMYASGARQLAGGFGLFGGMAAFSAVGMIVRSRGAGRKMSWGELTSRRRKWFADQDDTRDQVDVQRRMQWEHRRFFHWEPAELLNIAGSPRMWDRAPSSEMFSVVRVGVGKVKLAMQLVLPSIARPAELEPATGHALRRFVNAQEYVDGMPKAIWLQRFPGLSFVGDLGQARGAARAMLCQLAAFHSPADLQIIVVSAAPSEWEWAKWLPHFQHADLRDGCGERRLLFGSPAELEMFFDQDPAGARQAWSQPSSSFSDTAGVSPLRVIVDDNCGTPEDWAGLTGAAGYAGTCFLRLASSAPPRPADALVGGSKYWVGFAPETLYRISNGVLRKQVHLDERQQQSAAMYGSAETSSDELDDAFYATADQLSADEAERFARTLAPYRAHGSTSVAIAEDIEQRTLLDALGIKDPRHLDTDRLWAATRAQGPQWMRFPIGVFSDTGEVAELNLREGSQGGMGMHGLFIGTTGAGKTEGLYTEVASACLTHSPDVLNIVFTDFKLRSAAGAIAQFPHCVAAVSNLTEERHLVGRLYDTLDGELDRRGEMLAELPDCPDVTTYNQRRLLDPSLPPIPALWVITDEYNEVFADPIYGPKFRRLYLRIARVGRSLHVFLKLVGQTKDSQNLRDITKLLGYTQVGRVATEEEARLAIDDTRPAHIAPTGEEGTGYMRVALTHPRRFRFFYSSADWSPAAPGSELDAGPQRAAAEFIPRLFTAAEAVDVDQRVNPPLQIPEIAAAPVPAEPAEKPGKLLTLITNSLRAADEWPPRAIWLPVLDEPTPVDELVGRWRGRPWHVDYGNTAGLSLPVALADYPRGSRQEPYCLNLLRDNALIVGAPNRGATTAVMTMVTAAALLYRPERVQFYCIAASGPQLSRVGALPHVATVVANSDAEGVRRVIATVDAIATERDRIFTTQRLDMDKVRVAKFASERGPAMNTDELAAARAVPGGDVVLVIDGWKNFAETHQKLTDKVHELMRARNYGIRVVYTHTSTIAGLTSTLKSETGQTLELKLVSEHETTVKRDPREPERIPAREVPDRPGRGLTADGHHLMVGAPVLAHPPGTQGHPQSDGAPLQGDQLSEVVREVAGVSEVTTVARLPEKVLLADVFAGITEPLLTGVVPFGLAEANVAGSPLVTATIDFADHQHAVATGTAGAGLSAWARAMMLGIMRSYRPDEATIILIEYRRANVGVVPSDNWLAAYASNPQHIADVIKDLCALLEQRRPPATATPEELATTRFWEGREFFVVIDGLTAWSVHASPLAALAPYVGDAEDLGLHIVGTADIRQYSIQAQSNGVLGKMAGLSTATLVMNGERVHGQILPGVFAEPQREGKGRLVTRRGSEGVLVGWSEPPQISRRR